MAATKTAKRRGTSLVSDLRSTANGSNIPPRALKPLAQLMGYTQGLPQDKRTEFLRSTRG